jgi:hypothetical protein
MLRRLLCLVSLKMSMALFLLLAGALLAVLWSRRQPPAPVDAGVRSPPRASGEPLEDVEIVQGKLHVRIFSHVISSEAGPVPCWTYVSDGLLASGHKEIVLTVKREPGEGERDFPRAPLDLYRVVHGYAIQKQLVSEGGSTRLDPARPGLLRDDFHAILYTPPQPLAGVSTPGPFLTAVLVTGPELEVADRFGHLRLMALLGDRYRFYPTAPWADRRRPEITRPEAMASSILARMPASHLHGASVRLEPGPGGSLGAGAKIVLRLRQEAATELLGKIEKAGSDSAFAFSMDLDREADACLVWSPGREGLNAISMPGATGARIAGNMLLIAPQAKQDGARVAEDGFGLQLTDASWARFRAALAAREPLTLPGADDRMSFTLSWVEERYDNPIDGKAYVVPEGWRTHFPGRAPDALAASKTSVVKPTGIRLLTPEEQMEGRVQVKALADYLAKIDALLEAELGGDTTGPPFDLLVQLDLAPPHDAKTVIAARPSEMAPPRLSAVATRLQAIPAPPIRGGPVSLQVGYTVRGGTGERIP